MLWLKSCPKCGGDLFGETQSRYDDVSCLQCGYVLYTAIGAERRPAAAGRSPAAVA
jgi:predicted nucleic-acid-binding Zn-ribbon protein